MPKKDTINPTLGVSDANLRSQIRSALRKVWRNSSRRRFIESVRTEYKGSGRYKYGVVCAVCGRSMGQTEKEYAVLKCGAVSKKRKLVYEIDHIHSNHTFLDIVRDLGKYAHTLFYGDMQVLCRKCHGEKT